MPHIVVPHDGLRCREIFTMSLLFLCRGASLLTNPIRDCTGRNWPTGLRIYRRLTNVSERNTGRRQRVNIARHWQNSTTQRDHCGTITFMSQPDNSTKVSTWMLSAPPKVWVVQSIGAVAFSTVVLGTAVLGPERRTALHFYSAFSIAVVVCTIFLSVLCGRLWRARLRLIVTGVIVVVTSYLMGWLSMIAANAGQ